MASRLVLAVTFVLDLTAFAFAVAAEQMCTSTIQTDGYSSYDCFFDSDIATSLGVGAFLLLLTSQALLVIVTRRWPSGRFLRPSGSRAWTIVLFMTSWFFFCNAEVCLLTGSVRSAHQALRKGIFGAGAFFVLCTGIVSEFYHVSYSKANDEEAHYARDTGVRMQHPAFEISDLSDISPIYRRYLKNDVISSSSV